MYLFSVEKKKSQVPGFELTSATGEKKLKKLKENNRKEKKKKHLTVVDPGTLYILAQL